MELSKEQIEEAAKAARITAMGQPNWIGTDRHWNDIEDHYRQEWRDAVIAAAPHLQYAPPPISADRVERALLAFYEKLPPVTHLSEISRQSMTRVLRMVDAEREAEVTEFKEKLRDMEAIEDSQHRCVMQNEELRDQVEILKSEHAKEMNTLCMQAMDALGLMSDDPMSPELVLSAIKHEVKEREQFEAAVEKNALARKEEMAALREKYEKALESVTDEEWSSHNHFHERGPKAWECLTRTQIDITLATRRAQLDPKPDPTFEDKVRDLMIERFGKVAALPPYKETIGLFVAIVEAEVTRRSVGEK